MTKFATGPQMLSTTTKNIKMDKEKITPGSRFATGRPSTGRTHSITLRISLSAKKILHEHSNKSAFIDKLIIDSAKDKDK